MYPGKLKTSSNIAWHRPASNSSRIDRELMEKSSRALSSAKDPLEKLRLLCLTRGAAGIMGFGRIIRMMDENNAKRLTKDHFMYTLKETDVELTDEDKEELYKKFDPENNGSLCIDTFIRELRPPLSNYRLQILENAFRKLDKDGHGVAHVDDLRHVYSVHANCRYKSGEETEEVILKKFLDNFETAGEHDGKITLEEFLNYYSGISASVDDDCTFDLMIRQAFNL